MSKVALLWDESYLWGLMAYKSLLNLRTSFDILNSIDLKRVLNDDYSILLVPGGWASNKKETLG
ncbi:MAG: hypothetical protein N2738_04455, partial [Thermodesulfovibrionales bacterium]|nr:hypothetical protein [Thermodesulfovibrionales bacterium]